MYFRTIFYHFSSFCNTNTNVWQIFGVPFLCKDCDWTLVLILKVLLLNCDVGKFGSGTQPCAFAWNVGRIFARHLLCKKRWISCVFLNDVELNPCGVFGCMVIYMFCFENCFFQLKRSDVIRLKRRWSCIYVQIRHTS